MWNHHNKQEITDVSSLLRAEQNKWKWLVGKWLMGIIFVVVAGMTYVHSMASTVPEAATKTVHVANLHPGDTAPNFQVSSTAGPLDLAQVQRPVLLEAYAGWCPHCQREVSVLNKIYQKYGYRVQVIAVSASNIAIDRISPESQADVMTFAKAFNVQYPIAFDPNLTVANSYLSQGYPTIVIIDTNKKISSTTSGEQTEAQLAKRIKAVLQ